MGSSLLPSKTSKVTFMVNDADGNSEVSSSFRKPSVKSITSLHKGSQELVENIAKSPSSDRALPNVEADVVGDEVVPTPTDNKEKKSKKQPADKKKKKTASVVAPADGNLYSSAELIKRFSKQPTAEGTVKKKSKKSKTKQQTATSEENQEVDVVISRVSYELIPEADEDEANVETTVEPEEIEETGEKEGEKPVKKGKSHKSQVTTSENEQSEKPEKKDKEHSANKAKGKGKAKGGKGAKKESKHVRLSTETPEEINPEEGYHTKSLLTIKSEPMSTISQSKEKGQSVKLSTLSTVPSILSKTSKISKISRGSRFHLDDEDEDEDDESSSSVLDDQISLQKKKSYKSTKTSKLFKKKSTMKSDSFTGVYEDEEVLQNIIQPASTNQVLATGEGKKDKKAKAKKGAKPKERKGPGGKKEKKPAKTEAALEEEAKAKAEEERIMALEAKQEAISQEKRELLEASLRGEQLDQVTTLMQKVSDALEKVTQEEQAAEEWKQYLVCDGLPAPWDVPGMNTYLHLWEKEINTVTADRCRDRTKEAIKLLEQLDEIRDDPFDKSPSKQSDWAWVSSRFREFQSLNLEYCTYRLLRDIKSKMNRIDIPTSDFRMHDDLFSLCLWVSITLPTPTPNPRQVTKTRISLQWPEMSIDAIIFPQALKREMVAIRGMYTKYDHLSETCGSFRVKSIPEFYNKSLKVACFNEIYCKMKYKYDNRVIVPKVPVEIIQEDGTVVIEEPEPEPELAPDEIPPIVPYQKLEVSPTDHCLTAIADEITDALRQFAIEDVLPLVVNMRKYTVIGGLYYLDYFYQPPQPQGLVSYEIFISSLIAPYSLQAAPFKVEYVPPTPFEPGTRRTPEEIEEDLQQQEKELDELIFVLITLPTHVYWLEPPMIVQWNYDYKAWTTDEIFDFKNIEEKGYVTFRTGVFRPIGIATLRWSNMPYQAWEIRPENDGTVTFQLSCAILTLEFHVVKNTICVKDIQSAPNNAFDQHLNVYYRFSKLRMIMKSIGIDVFPFFDIFLYVDGTCEKYWPMENHLYFCMAYISMVFNMTWSRWNNTLDYRSAVFQMRIHRFDRPKQANFDTVLVRAQHTMYIDCTEVSQEFSDTPAENMRFFVDLWHLVRSTTTKSLRAKITDADKTMVKTLYRLYKNVRFLSLS